MPFNLVGSSFNEFLMYPLPSHSYELLSPVYFTGRKFKSNNLEYMDAYRSIFHHLTFLLTEDS